MNKSDEAKQLLANYFKSMPATDMGVYDSTLENSTEEEEQLSAWKLAIEPKKWKRTHKYKNIEEMHWIGEDQTLEVQVSDNQGNYTSTRISREFFVLFREFVCAEEKLGTSLRYLILEDSQGKLFVGECIGD